MSAKSSHTLAALVVCSATNALAGVPSATEVLAKADVAEGFASYYTEMQQIITTTGGQKRTLVMRAWAVRSGEKQLAEYLAPADIKGQKLLMTDHGDNIWMFNPETRRTRKLGSHMRKRKVMGSDFSYEDQAGGKLSQKYAGQVVEEEEIGGVQTFKLVLEPTPEGPSYDKIIAWVGKEDSILRRVDYFEDGEATPFKRLIATDIKMASGKKVSHRLTMTNLRDKTETINIITRITFGAKIPESIFESRNMER